MRWMKVENGQAIGPARGRPTVTTIPAIYAGDVLVQDAAQVGCDHWPDELLLEHGWWPVDGAADPAIATESGYEADAEAQVVRPIIAARPIEQVRAAAIREIDAAAEQVRERYITPGAGQAMTYQRKLEEARAFQADEEGPFPILEASIGADGADLAEVAATVQATSTAWTLIAAQIEGVRLGAKRAIEAAESGAAVRAIVAAAVWPSP